jgi:hypothetical protein
MNLARAVALTAGPAALPILLGQTAGMTARDWATILSVLLMLLGALWSVSRWFARLELRLQSVPKLRRRVSSVERIVERLPCQQPAPQCPALPAPAPIPQG